MQRAVSQNGRGNRKDRLFFRISVNSMKLLTQRIEPASVVVENFSLGRIAELLILDDGLRRAGESAIEMTVIRCKYDPVITDGFNDVGKLGFIGLA